MTFTEAAVEVLRLVGKPLHYKKITEVAIERNLLSHVGKTPEVTMSSRLATMVKRDRGEAPIIKVKPGVFGLREFNEEQLADLSGDVDELPEVEVENEQDKAQELRESAVEVVSISPANETRKPLPGADVFPEEEDDDEPILGADEEEEDEDEAEGDEPLLRDAAQSAESRSSRRRRKRRRRGGPEEAGTEVEARPREVRESRDGRELRESREPRSGREQRREEREQRREERRRERDERRDRDEPLDMSREPGEGDLLGKDLADAVASVLAQGGPRGLPALRIADQLVRRGRLAGDPNTLVPTIMAALRADIARRRSEPSRPRFRLDGGAVVLTDFLLPQDVLRAEQEVVRAAERQRDRARRAFLRRVTELPGAGVAELIATWLNAEGVVGLRAVRRPGAGVGELHFAGTLRRGADEVRLAIVVYREAREIGRERVIEARGALHYYGNASMAWLISLGGVVSGAREEASAPASAPVALYDGLALAAAMERQGVGLVAQAVPIATLDFELLDALRGGSRERERDLEPERGRDRRDRDRERDRERERERDRERPARPQPLERVRVREEVDVELLEEEVEEDPALDEGDEVIEAALQEASPIATEAGAEGREGGRRRRRRRRRKGRGQEAQVAASSSPDAGGIEASEEAQWAEGDEIEDEDDDDEAAELARGQLESDARDSFLDTDEDSYAPRERERDDDESEDDLESVAEESSEEASDEDEDDQDDDERDTSDERAAREPESSERDASRDEGERERDPSVEEDERRDPFSNRRGHG